ncbi:MAG: hypothetical protein IJW21_02415 [Clostridia bacterium]|nr:hypothetical protein [Clostridia bacterium]
MAFWGMGLEECDEFCEVYDDFADMYDAGGEPHEISVILQKKYGGISAMPHNVCFALAMAEWNFCARTEAVLAAAREIIESGANIAYYRSLGFSEEELSERGEKLAAFLKKIQSPKKSARKRKVSAHNKIKRLPKGTVSWYECGGAYYGFVVLDAVYNGRLLAVTESLPSPPKSTEDVLSAPALTAIWLLLEHTPVGNHDIGKVDIGGSYNGRAGVFLCKRVSFGLNFSFYLDECHRRKYFDFNGAKTAELLREDAVPIEFLCGESAESEKKMVLELMQNPASPLAKDMICRALTLRGFLN